MRRLLPPVFALSLVHSGLSLAVELDSISTELNLTYGFGTSESRTSQSELELLPRFELTLADSVQFVGSARLRYENNNFSDPVDGRMESYSPLSKPYAFDGRGSLELRDFYLEWFDGSGRIRLGKQQIVWGRLDGIKVLDLVNPQDYREFILEDFDRSRVPLWSAYFDYSLGDWRVELALVPDGSGHSIPAEDSWFALTAPRFRFGASSPVAIPQRIESPGHSIDEAAAGVRMTRQYDNVEFSAVAYTGLDPEPLGRLVVENNAAFLERYYKRHDVFGVSGEIGLGSVVIRGEYAYQPDRYFNLRTGNQLLAAPLDQHRAALAMDISAPLDIFANIQFVFDHIESAPEQLVRPVTDKLATLYLRRGFNYDNLIAKARWYHSFEDGDNLLSLILDYDIDDNSSLSLSGDFFDGVDSGLFGQFDKRDRVTLTYKYMF